MPQPNVFYGVRSCPLPAVKPRKPRKPAAGLSSNPTNPPNPAAGLSQQVSQLHATCSSHLFSKAFKSCCLPELKPLIHRTAGLSKATTFAAPCPSQVFFTAFAAALCPPSNPANPANPLQAFPQTPQTPPNRAAGLSQQVSQLHATCSSHLVLRAFKAAVCRLWNPSYTAPQPCPRQPLSQPHAPARSFLRRSKLPFARRQTPQTPQTPLQNPAHPPNPAAGLSQATSLAATCYMLQPSIFKGVQGCCLPALKPLIHRTATLSKATTFAATCPSQVFVYGVRSCRLPAVKPRKPRCRPFLKPHKPPKPCRRPFPTSLAATCYMLQPSIFKGVQGCCLPALKPLIHRTAGLSKATTFAAPCPSQVFFTALEAAVCPVKPRKPRRRLTKGPSIGDKILWFTVSHGLMSVLARTILFSCMVSQPACHAWRESHRPNGMTTQQFDTRGMSGHGYTSLPWHGHPSHKICCRRRFYGLCLFPLFSCYVNFPRCKMGTCKRKLLPLCVWDYMAEGYHPCPPPKEGGSTAPGR